MFDNHRFFVDKLLVILEDHSIPFCEGLLIIDKLMIITKLRPLYPAFGTLVWFGLRGLVWF